MKYIKPLNEARPMFQETPNEFAYLDFKKWAYKNRGKINKNAKEWSYLHATDVARKDFGRALAIMLKKDDLIIKKQGNKLTDLK